MKYVRHHIPVPVAGDWHHGLSPWHVVTQENPERGDHDVYLTECGLRITSETHQGIRASELPHALATMCGACVAASSRGEVVA